MSLGTRTVSRASRALLRCNRNRPLTSLQARPHILTKDLQAIRVAALLPRTFTGHSFHTTTRTFKGLQPDTDDPEPPSTEADVAGGSAHLAEPADISADEYHEIADEYIDVILGRLEALAEDLGKGLEVEYSVRFANLAGLKELVNWQFTFGRIPAAPSICFCHTRD